MNDLNEYEKIMAERPRKLTAEQVDYEPSENDVEKCENCVHLYFRSVDKFTVCEIFRSEETDEDGVRPNWKCKFFTRDGTTFPSLETKR